MPDPYYNRLTYGPGSPDATKSDRTQFTGSYGNHLAAGDIAASPLGGFPSPGPNSYWTDPQTGTTYHVADSSNYSPGNPTPAGTWEQYYPGSSTAFGGSGKTNMFGQYSSPSDVLDGKVAQALGVVPYVGAGLKAGNLLWKLGGSIGNIFKGGSTSLDNSSIDFGTPTPDNVSPAAQAYQSISNPDLQPRTPNGGMVPGGVAPPPRAEYGGTGFGNYAQAQNSFIPGMVAWNGPGQAQGPGGEQSASDIRGGTQFLQLSRRLGGMGVDPNASMAHAIAASQQATPGFATAHLPQIRGRG